MAELVITARIRRMGKVIFSLCVSVHTSTGGGSQVSDFTGGFPGLRFLGGSPASDFQGGHWSQIFFLGGGRSPVSVKGKIFDTRFGLIHVQTGENFFVEGPPPSKGKNF